MTNIEYLNSMATKNDRIYIDTASLMNPDCFQQFVEKAESIFMAASKRITISTAVRSELGRHVSLSNIVKRESALEALSIIQQHRNLFDIPDDELNEEDIGKAFADAELLAELMIHKKEGNQLLITNDRKLSSDAYELNKLQSCLGHRIYVCHITRFGFLQICDCVNTFIKAEVEHPSLAESAPTIMPQDHAEQCASNTEEPCIPLEVEEQGKTVFGTKQILALGGTFVVGFLVGKYGGKVAKGVARFVTKIV